MSRATHHRAAHQIGDVDASARIQMNLAVAGDDQVRSYLIDPPDTCAKTGVCALLRGLRPQCAREPAATMAATQGDYRDEPLTAHRQFDVTTAAREAESTPE